MLTEGFLLPWLNSFRGTSSVGSFQVSRKMPEELTRCQEASLFRKVLLLGSACWQESPVFDGGHSATGWATSVIWFQVIEGFLSKEVSYIVSSRREVKAESSGKSHRGCPSPSPSEVRVETSAMVDPKGSHPRPSRKPVDSVPLSRGKELLQKAIRNQGSISGGGSGGSSSLLTNARSWGVRILHVDEMMMHVQQLSLASLCVKKQQPKKPEGTCPAAESRTRKVARLKAPFLKIEDESRESKDGEPSPRSAAHTMPRRKKGYCECCQEAFEELHVHLQSAQHRSFALEAHLYAEVDRIIAQLSHSFADIPFQAGLPSDPRQGCGPAAMDRITRWCDGTSCKSHMCECHNPPAGLAQGLQGAGLPLSLPSLLYPVSSGHFLGSAAWGVVACRGHAPPSLPRKLLCPGGHSC
ncbi:protein DBF4 homolog B isoform X17 [Homo sapiens]|uniref:protein DBF4 homolog B isoform X17 n=1 Tax=Homo sapiens TaxID=9606 RepID=UPI001FB130E7|nr:protein DBF4 homolog B isoform X17 [Homo sapiens]XP_054173342.1 protein DBF4 homolog B isoform X17 [Homo sapiens]